MAESDRKKCLSPKKEVAIRAILNTLSLQDACAQAKVSSRTLRRYMADDEFRRRLREAYRETLEAAISRAQHLSDDAVKTLHDLHNDRSAPANSRVAAAKALAALGWKAAEVGDMREELEAVKRRVSEVEEAL